MYDSEFNREAPLTPHLSRFRRLAGDWLFVIGCTLVAMAILPNDGLWSIGLVIGGTVFIGMSHLFYPFRDQLDRLHCVPLSDPSHEINLVDKKGDSGKDAV
jgi:hypothetical protein